MAYSHTFLTSSTLVGEIRRERGGHGTSSFRETRRPGKFKRMRSVDILAVCVLLKPDVFSVYLIFLQVREEKISERSNVTLRIHRHCLASFIKPFY